MHSHLRPSLSHGLLQAALVSTMLLVPLICPAQTFYGSGGTTSTATFASNVALGYAALYNNTTGNNNTATGYAALFSNTGDSNTAYGYSALLTN